MRLSTTLHRLKSRLIDNPRLLRLLSIGLSFGIIGCFLLGCGQSPASTASSGAAFRDATVALPTEVPTLAPSPVNTRVMPLEEFTSVPTSAITPTITPIPDEVRALVVEVINGDTIGVVMQGDPPSRIYEVRYLGIEAPPNAPNTPWGSVAYESNRKLTNLKVVRLVRDQTDFDDEGRLLRYVYVGDELLSIILAEQGLARANIVEPDTRFQAEIEEAEARARDGRLGLWGQPPTPTPPRSQPVTPEAEATPEPEATPSATVVNTATPASTQEATEEPLNESSSAGDTGETPTSTTEPENSQTPSTGNSEGDTNSDDQLQGPQ